jgi:hypothetical protein
MGQRLEHSRTCRSRYFRLDPSCTSFLSVIGVLLVLEVVVKRCYTFGHNYHFNTLRNGGVSNTITSNTRLLLQKVTNPSQGQGTNVPSTDISASSSSVRSRSTTSSSSLYAGGVGEMMMMPMILVGVAAGASSVIGTITEAQRGGRPRFYPPPQRRRYFGDRDDRELPLYLPSLRQQQRLPMSAFVPPPPLQRQQPRFLPQPLPPPASLPLYDSPRGDGFYQNNDDNYDRYAAERDRVYIDREPYNDRYDEPVEYQRFRSSGGTGSGTGGRSKSGSNDSFMNSGRDRNDRNNNDNFDRTNSPWGWNNNDNSDNKMNINNYEGREQRRFDRNRYDDNQSSSFRGNSNYDSFGSGSSSSSRRRSMSNNDDRRMMTSSSRGSGMDTRGDMNGVSGRNGPQSSSDGPRFSSSNSFSNYNDNSSRRPPNGNNNNRYDNTRPSNTAGGWNQGNDYSPNGRGSSNSKMNDYNNYYDPRSSSRESDNYRNQDMMYDNRAGLSSSSRAGGGGSGAPWYSSANTFTSYLDLSGDEMNNKNNPSFPSNDYGSSMGRRDDRGSSRGGQDSGPYNTNYGYNNGYNDSQMPRGTGNDGGRGRMMNERPSGMPYTDQSFSNRRMGDDTASSRMRGSPGPGRGIGPSRGQEMGPVPGRGIGRGEAPFPGREMGPPQGPGRGMGSGQDMGPFHGMGPGPGRDRPDFMENRNDMNRRGNDDYYSNSESSRPGRSNTFGPTTSFAADPEPWYSPSNVRKNAFDDKSSSSGGGGSSSSGGSSRSSFRNFGNTNNRNGGPSSSSSRRWAVPLAQQEYSSYHSHFFDDDFDDFENHPIAMTGETNIHIQRIMIDNGRRLFQQQFQYHYSTPADNFYFDNNFDDIYLPWQETMTLLGSLEGKIRHPMTNKIPTNKKSPLKSTTNSPNILDATIESKTIEK